MPFIPHTDDDEREQLHGAPHRLPVRRLDEVRAARELNLIYQEAGG